MVSLFRPQGCKIWYFRVPRTVDSRRRISTGKTSKEQAEAFARQWRRSERVRTYAQHDAAPLSEHLDAWISGLREFKGLDDDWLRQKRTHLERLIAGCGWTRLSHFDANEAAEWLDRRVTTGKMRRNTCNHWISDIRQFGRWLVSNGRMATDPLGAKDPAGQAILRKRKARDADKAYQRRPISDKDLDKLIATAATWRLHKISGQDRAEIYRLAATTGLRRGEIAKLTRESFHLDLDPPVVVLPGSQTKNGNIAMQPLRADVVAALRPWLATKRPGVPLFPRLTDKRTVRMIEKDLERAGIAVDIPGLGRVDMHSLRYTYACALILSGAELPVTQRLMRHSTPVLTSNIYARVGLADLAKAVERTKPERANLAQSGEQSH